MGTKSPNQNPDWRYSPTQTEMNEQSIKELSSRVQSLEDAMKQLQSTVLSGTETPPSPIGVNLDEVAPPPWQTGSPAQKKAKLLLPRMGRPRQVEKANRAAADYSYIPLLKILLPRAFREIRRLLIESEYARYVSSLDGARVFKMWSACNNRCIEVHLSPEPPVPNDSTTGFELAAPDGGQLVFAVVDGEIKKINMVGFAAASRDELFRGSRSPEPFAHLNPTKGC
jgi:hypothetical protein